MKIAVAGATGNLGSQIIHYLIKKGASVTALVRDGSPDISSIPKGLTIVKVNYDNAKSLASAMEGADCVVSALSGVREVIVDTQTKLLNAALDSGVHRFIPSDFCIDYRPLKHGSNRNLDFRREFSTIVDGSPIKATSILNGMFTDLLKGEAPVILEKKKRIFFWGDPDQKMDFTSIDNTAEVTAEAAMDNSSPRWVRIAGEEASMQDLKNIAEEVFGGDFKFLRPGGLNAFSLLIKITKTFSPGKNETFPAWQGMQYLHDMLSGVPKHRQLDNNLYPKVRWTKIESVLKE